MKVDDVLAHFEYTPNELAAVLNVSVVTIYSWRFKGRIPDNKQYVLKKLSKGALVPVIAKRVPKDHSAIALERAEACFESFSKKHEKVLKKFQESESALKKWEETVANLKKSKA